MQGEIHQSQVKKRMTEQINFIPVHMGHGPGDLVFEISLQKRNGGGIGRGNFKKTRGNLLSFDLAGNRQVTHRGKERLQQIQGRGIKTPLI